MDNKLRGRASPLRDASAGFSPLFGHRQSSKASFLALAAGLFFNACSQPADAPSRAPADRSASAGIELESLTIQTEPSGASFALFPKTFEGAQKNYLVQYETGQPERFILRLGLKDTNDSASILHNGAPLGAERDGSYTVPADKSAALTIQLKGAGGTGEYRVTFTAGKSAGSVDGMRKVSLMPGSAPNTWTIPEASAQGAYFAYVTFTGTAQSARMPLASLSATPALVGAGAPARFSEWSAADTGAITIVDGEPAISAVYLGAEFYYHFLYDKEETNEAARNAAGSLSSRLAALEAEMAGLKQTVEDVTLRQIPDLSQRILLLDAQAATLSSSTIPGIQADMRTVEADIKDVQAKLAGIQQNTQTFTGTNADAVAFAPGAFTIDAPTASNHYFAYVKFASGDAETVVFGQLSAAPSGVGPAAMTPKSFWVKGADGSVHVTQGGIDITGLWVSSQFQFELVSSWSARAGALETRLESLARQLSGLETWKTSAESALAALQADALVTRNTLADVNTWKSGAQQRIASLESLVSQLDTQMSAAQARIQALLDDAGALKLALVFSGSTYQIAPSAAGAFYVAYVLFSGSDRAELVPLAGLGAAAQAVGPAAAPLKSLWSKNPADGTITVTNGNPAITGIYLGQEFLYKRLVAENARFGSIEQSLSSLDSAVNAVDAALAALNRDFGSKTLSANYGWARAAGSSAGLKYAKLAEFSLASGAQAGAREARGSFSVSRNIYSAPTNAAYGSFLIEALSATPSSFGTVSKALVAGGADANLTGLNLGFALDAPGAALSVYAESDKSYAIADIKVELARTGSGETLTVEGQNGAAWNSVKPANYTPFTKQPAANTVDEVTGTAAGVETNSAVCAISGQRVIRSGKMRQLSFVATIKASGNGGIQLANAADFPKTETSMTVYANWISGGSVNRFGIWRLSASGACVVSWPNGANTGPGDTYTVHMTYIAP